MTAIAECTQALNGERFWHYVLKLRFKVENEAQKPTLSIPGYERHPLEHCQMFSCIGLLATHTHTQEKKKG